MKRHKVKKLVAKIIGEELAKYDSRIYDIEVKTGTKAFEIRKDTFSKPILGDIAVKDAEYISDVSKKEITELPEFWVVKRNRENCEIINKWAEKTFNMCFKDAVYFISSTGWCFYDIPSTYTEIPFSDFERLVLKKEQPKQKEIDWSVPGQLVRDPDGFIVMTSGKHDNLQFEGCVIQGPLSVGKYDSLLNKSEFTLFNGSICLKND